MSIIKCKGEKCEKLGRCITADTIGTCYVEKLKNIKNIKYIVSFNYSDVKYLDYTLIFSKLYFETIVYDHLTDRLG